MAKRICVIGAGPSGLAAIKTCLEEGLEPVCYERTNDFGGLWRYRNEDEEGIPSVMKSTIINSSKELSAFSDFPPDPELSNFMHNTSVVKYLEDYINSFKLAPYIVYNHTVVKVDYAADYDTNGKWTVQVQEKNKGVKEETFDAVMICIGHHVYPHVPKFPGDDVFKGDIIHTHSYKVPNGYEDKNVLVVGIGNSGGDVAVELSRIGKKIYLSTRRGSWISNRIGVKGYPLDTALLSRFNLQMISLTPKSFTNTILETGLNNRFDHAHYGLKPKHRALEQHVMVNDDMPNRIASGTLIIKSDIHHFTENGVVFKEEENTEYPIDSVILATGYNITFPFLSEDVIAVKENKLSLYKYVFPPKLKHPTLCVIGLIQPLGSILPISEIQCRWATQVFKGDCQLPPITTMLEDIEATKDYLSKHFVQTQRHTVQVDYIPYCDSIGEMIGVKPNLLKIFFTDPQLFTTMYFGPCYPYQYRLNGPHTWPGATNAILTGHKRILAPLNHRKSSDVINKPFVLLRMIIFLIFIGHTILTLLHLGAF